MQHCNAQMTAIYAGLAGIIVLILNHDTAETCKERCVRSWCGQMYVCKLRHMKCWLLIFIMGQGQGLVGWLVAEEEKLYHRVLPTMVPGSRCCAACVQQSLLSTWYSFRSTLQMCFPFVSLPRYSPLCHGQWTHLPGSINPRMIW